MTLFSNKFILFLILITAFNYSYQNGYAQNSSSKMIIESAGDGLQILLPASAFIYSYLTQDKAGEEQFIQSFFLTCNCQLLFHEYFHGDTGEGLGASHQSGWTALAAALLAGRGGRIRTR